MLPVATASADISAKIVVPNSRIRSTRGLGTSLTLTGSTLVSPPRRGSVCAAQRLARARARSFSRSCPDSTAFRSRTAEGVTSTHSSSRQNSSACSSDSCRCGMSRTSSSPVDERMLVSFFSLVAFTSKSSAREFSPTIIPS